jgi:Tfp pilus assembly protein PilN
MIERINLIQKDPFKFTYRRVVQVIGSALVLCALLFGSMMFRLNLNNKDMTKLKQQISELEAQRQVLLKAAPTKVDTGPFSDVKNQLVTTPPWSEFVTDIGNRLPVGSYLTSLSASVAQKQPAKADAKKEAKQITTKEGAVVVTGISKNADEMSFFATKLKDSIYVDTVALKSSEKVDQGFSFVIESQLSANPELKISK